MGLKRKASALYDPIPLPFSFAFPPQSHPSLSQQIPSSPPSMTSASTHSSPSSMTTEPYQTDLPPLHQPNFNHYQPYSANKDKNDPWRDVRTRKRHRDNRPDEEEVHKETMRKLFTAQKQHLHANLTIPISYEEADVMDADLDGDTVVDVLDVRLEALETPEANQRSIHDFFGGKSKQQTQPQQPAQMAQLVEHDGMDVDQGGGYTGRRSSE